MPIEYTVTADSFFDEFVETLLEFDKNPVRELADKISVMIMDYLRVFSNTHDNNVEYVHTIRAIIGNILTKEKIEVLVKLSDKFPKDVVDLNLMSRRSFLKGMVLGAAAVFLFPETVFGLSAKKKVLPIATVNMAKKSNDYIIKHKFIIYHETAGYDSGVEESFRQRGTSAHYLIFRDGSVKAIIPENRVASHAGLSYWEKYDGINSYSIGIECVDNRTHGLTESQYISLRDLIKKLQRKYNIVDECVLPHAMVRTFFYRKKRIRGGKPCGMGFNRRKLCLRKIPEDIAVKTNKIGRNTVIDRLCASVNDYDSSDEKIMAEVEESSILRGTEITAWKIAGQDYNSNETIYFNKNGVIRGRGIILSGDEISEDEWSVLQEGTKVYTDATKKFVCMVNGIEEEKDKVPVIFEIKQGLNFPKELKDKVRSETTIYVVKSRWSKKIKFCRGDLVKRIDIKKGGIVITGVDVPVPFDVSKTNASFIVGESYKSARVVYVFADGTVKLGNEVDSSKLPVGTVFFVRSG